MSPPGPRGGGSIPGGALRYCAEGWWQGGFEASSVGELGRFLYRLIVFNPSTTIMCPITLPILLLSIPCGPTGVLRDEPIMRWSFGGTEEGEARGETNRGPDSLEGNLEPAPGVLGEGLRLDGFTACVRRAPEYVKHPDGDFTVEAWVALGSYPWNWCPVITTESEGVAGYRLMLGPLGQASLQVAVDGEWASCESSAAAVPSRTWTHVVGVCEDGKALRLYLDGREVASSPIEGEVLHDTDAECRIGMVAAPEKPSDIHREWGTVATWFGIDGIVDEIAVHDAALDATAIRAGFESISPSAPDIAPRRLPTIATHPGRFGAFYTKLEYWPGWDALWPVEQDPDVVVCFERSPVKLIFWRGIRYGASWVSENGNWMSDQSVEAWGQGEADREGCFEHMQDRHCRFSHVRIIESTPARAVVHWRYAPVSAHENTWRRDPKTDWECWVDEYYYVYPDATGIRRVSWKTGTLGRPRQFQETLALLHPGQVVSDLLEKVFVRVADYAGERGEGLTVEDPNSPPYGPFRWDDPRPFTVQQYQFKSEHKPFICFEPGNTMHIRHRSLGSYDRAAGCNHFPVGQARCDGRTTRTADRPSHCSSFPISDPVVHEEAGRSYWCGLYGMNDRALDQVVELGRSWAFAPELTDLTPGFSSEGYDRSRRCYILIGGTDAPDSVSFTLKGTEGSPVLNPALVIRNWRGEGARIIVNGADDADAEVGIVFELEGPELVLFLWHEATEQTRITVLPE